MDCMVCSADLLEPKIVHINNIRFAREKVIIVYL